MTLTNQVFRWESLQDLLAGRLMRWLKWCQLIMCILLWFCWLTEGKYLGVHSPGLEGLALIPFIIILGAFTAVAGIPLLIRLFAYHKVIKLSRTRTLAGVDIAVKLTQAGFVILLEGICAVPLMIWGVRIFREMLFYPHTLTERLLHPAVLLMLTACTVVGRSILRSMTFHRVLRLSVPQTNTPVSAKPLMALMLVTAVQILLCLSLMISWWWNWYNVLLAFIMVYDSIEMVLLFRCGKIWLLPNKKPL